MSATDEFREFAQSALPFGGVIAPCDSAGTLLRRPGTLPPVIVTTPAAADSELADAYRVRFDDTESRRAVSFITTDPWQRTPEGYWIIPVLNEQGLLASWFRVAPLETAP